MFRVATGTLLLESHCTMREQMGLIDDVLSGTALTSAWWPCLHFHCDSWFTHQKARAHVALLGSCFKNGWTKPYEYQQHWCTSDALWPEITTTISTALSPHHMVHSHREGPSYGVHHYGQELPFFLGCTRALNGRAISYQYETSPCRLTFSCCLVAPVQPMLVHVHEEYGTTLGKHHRTILVHVSGPSAVLEPAWSLHQPCLFLPDGFTYCLTLFSSAFYLSLMVLVYYWSCVNI